VPVVAARASSLPEIGSDAAVYADPLDVGAIATSLSDVLSSDQRRTQMRAAGIARAAGFTWERTARETMSVLRAALTGV
jgi:alpha-1,3-rhamnosyl/mannosyltransferase